ncbi:hypothetical protein [Thalassobacillus sp. CUG 92003]|uniref:hypothetical protein n=1 Tax=Thalassobacillus sp. CUG 92003 TaxID=2736641 RepID=UPI0015E71A1A|nr:hypothetical protein [Thalassobacillus sp. CUG 92003]
MARTQLTITDSELSGADVVFDSVDGTEGNVFPNSNNDYLFVKNDDASSIDVTVLSVPCSHGRTQDEVKSVAAGATAVLGPFPRALFGENVAVDFSSATSVTAAVVRR